jgi:hypothetical protein
VSPHIALCWATATAAFSTTLLSAWRAAGFVSAAAARRKACRASRGTAMAARRFSS